VPGQRQKGGELNRQHGAPRRVLARDKLLEEGLVGGKVGEVARAAQLERFAKAALEMPMRGLDRAVLMADAGVVAGWLHAVVAAELGIARGLVLLAREIAVSRREPVGAMFARHTTELPERFLKTLGKGGEALAAADRLDVLPAAEGEPEMVEQMRERRARNRHREAPAIGEI